MNSTTNPTGIVSDSDGSTVTITLDNPDAFNALRPEMIPALTEAVRTADTDAACRVIIITGRGDRAFCAGIDVKSVAARDQSSKGGNGVASDPIVEQFDNLHRELGDIIRTIHRAQTPVIAAVNGHAIGAGFAIAAAADLRLAGPQATFADGFVKRGISGCEMGLSYFLPAIVGHTAAFEMMLTGRRVDATTAVALGLISRVSDDGELIADAQTLAAEIASNAPMAVAMTKEVAWANRHAGSLDQALALESRTQIMARQTADAAEARAAFLEKRPPIFGRSRDERGA